ncbi:hypothetical protein [Tamilnaduibacter salinus]|uniref:hypothetical protein n=1 Tax=Tamilnaduibacter salinus TaxID=1484056 RepID=UPI000E3260F6|nr:hypothetical protein [Tamilnaduibacter salinus]
MAEFNKDSPYIPRRPEADDYYRTTDYLFRVTPESAYPVDPVDQAPAEKPIWRPIRQPLTALELYP